MCHYFRQRNRTKQIKQIENFLGKDIYKIPVPEELGEAPEYAPRDNHKKGRNQNAKNKGKRRPYNKRQGNKSNKDAAKAQ